jgi:hypothetical protein
MKHTPTPTRRARHVLGLSGFSPYLLASLSLCSFACDDPLVDPQTVVDLRVLAGQISASDDSSRASLRAGEDATVRWLVASDRREDLSALLVSCRVEPTTLGAPVCAKAPFYRQSLDGQSNQELSANFTLPAAFDTGDEWATWLGVCEGQRPQFDRDDSSFDCDGKPAISAFIRTAASNNDNDNPDLSDDELLLDGQPWSAAALGAPGDPCTDLDVPQVQRGETATIEFELQGDDRENIETDQDIYGSQPRESLVFTHVSTFPGLQRAYSVIAFDSDRPRIDVDFKLDEDSKIPADGRLVTFTLVARDERGGVGWISRQLCTVR